MASSVYANAKYLAATDQLQWVTATFRGLLVTAAYSFNFAQIHVSDVLSFEVAGGNYARQNIVGRQVYADIAGDRARLDATNPIFPLLTGVTPSGLIIYKQIGGDDLTPGNDPLICFIDFPTTPATGLNYMVEFDVDGVFVLTAC